ncbi:hypothetical protein D7Z26_06360 [Cohnella endophytica]|uniref:Uncharacterized protein n=1 Tax=Cohnella endophytica TaxID=2419778 RepID=A0A494Y469_9BACL|nr:hypothetical protein [Cohnella endophytica]RKP56255.1 hypothetical protein D7Z26_06360 [Cohnella endophytica]
MENYYSSEFVGKLLRGLGQFSKPLLIRLGYLQENLSLLRAFGFEDGVDHIVSSNKEKMKAKNQCYVFELKEEFKEVNV